MRKALFIFGLSCMVLLGAVSWEYLFNQSSRKNWVDRFESRLHQKEKEADEILAQFSDSTRVKLYEGKKDLIFAGFRKGEIFFWTDGIIGINGLYERLNAGDNFVRINNGFYEIRKAVFGETEYYALLHIKDAYPYNNKYVKDYFGEFLKIGVENANNIQVSRFASEGSSVVKSKDGVSLFYIRHNENYKDRSANYVLLFLYLLFFLSLFYVFDILLERAPSFGYQLLYIGGFILFLGWLRYTMLFYRIPASLYRLPIFDNNVSQEGLVSSIGDLLMSSFSIVQILYISFANLKIDYQKTWVKRYRYVIVGGLLPLAFLYMLFLNHTISSLIYSTDVYLNMAQVVDIKGSSIIAFVSIIMGGLGLIIVIDGSIGILLHLISLRKLVCFLCGFAFLMALFLYLYDYYINFWGCLFVAGLYILNALNRNHVKRDIQRSIYMLMMFLLSVYVVLVAKKYEQYRELLQRAFYSTELIEERDLNFEKKLAEVSSQINDSEVIADLVANYNEEFLKMCLTDELLDLKGYNYISEITLCQAGDSLRINESSELYDCHTYFRYLMDTYGEKIGHTNFYALVDFDGYISYIGAFVFGEVTLYLRFDSTNNSEGPGYPQILSRKSIEGENVIYPYSYAKYKEGQLIYSSGEFNYYKTLSRFGPYKGNIEIIEKDGYSHMFIPVDKEGVLVMSLKENIFSFYYLNVLYAFFVCVLLSSYGVFFSLNHDVNFRRGTLKARIKNSIVSLIFILFVILTALSIYLNARSFEERHKAKVTELMRYINKELEQLDCVEYQNCPEILDVLAQLSEVLTVDINIYSWQGMLVATSRPEIFSAGFNGYLVDAPALEEIVRKGGMIYVGKGQIGELGCMLAYMPLQLESGKNYVLNVPYFAQNDELNQDVVIMVIITINIVVIVMVLAFILSGVVAERVTKPLQLVNEKLKAMRLGGKNEKIDYSRRDEVGGLVRGYNDMVEKLEESVNQLAKSERESAWREMARQIAHEIKNPLTPMKLNIQFMQRSLQVEDQEEFKRRFKDISAILIEQIDNMASIASAFSDFAKIPVAQSEFFDISEMALNSGKLFEKNISHLEYEVQPGLMVFADKEQMHRVFVNILKNAVQSIPEEREGYIRLSVRKEGSEIFVRIRDNGCGIPETIRRKVFEPNFTTKTSGMGLGLAIVRRIIESMEGEISFTTSGLGTEFIIRLPSGEK